MNAAEKNALSNVAKSMSELAADMHATLGPRAQQPELERLRNLNGRLLKALKDLDAASRSTDEKEKAFAHYQALALIMEMEAA